MTRIVTGGFLKNIFRVCAGRALLTTSRCNRRLKVGDAHPASLSEMSSGGRKQERGFALVAAIFIVVILAMLGIMMVTIGGMERATSTTAVQGTRAYYAARSGIEWGVFGALNNTVPTCGALPSTPTTNTLNLAVTGLNGFTVSVVCSYTTHKERSDTYNVYVITSTATSGNFGDVDYVSRQLQVTATNALP
jgi:MSHA biogenesis protein MshP